MKTPDSSDLAAPETINRNAWQEGEKGQNFHFFRMLSSRREREQKHFKYFVQNPLHSFTAELLGITRKQLSGQDSYLKNFAAVAAVDLMGF